MFARSRAKISERLDVIIGILGIFIGTLVIYLSYAANLHQQDVGFAILIPCLIYLAFRSKLLKPTHDHFIPTKSLTLLLNIIFLIAFTGSIVLLRLNLYYRPPLYFILVSIACAVIAVEIFYSNEKTQVWSIITKILLLFLSVRAGIFYNFPALMGSDIWEHMKYVQAIIDNGMIIRNVESISYSFRYCDYPIFHLIVTITQILTHTTLKNSLFFSIGFFAVISTIFIYLIGKDIAGTKIGLLSALLFNMSDIIINRGVCNITIEVLVLGLFLMILYFVLKDRRETRNSAIIIFLIILLVITHQLSTFASFVSLAGIFIGKQLYDRYMRKETSINITLTSLMMFAIALQIYWMNTYKAKGAPFFDFVLRPIVHIIKTGDFIPDPLSNPYVILYEYYSPINNVLYHFGYLILLFFAILGILYWLSYKNINAKKSEVIAAFVVLYLIVYGITLSSFKDSMLPHRWLIFVYIFLCLAASQGIFTLTKLTKKKSNKIITVFCIILLLTFFMITTPIVNRDSPMYCEDRAARYMFKQSEIQGALTITKVYEGNIVLDRSWLHGLFRKLTYNATLECIDLSEEKYTGLILLRKAVINEYVTVGRAGISINKILGEEFFDRFNNSDYDLVYSNGEVFAYRSKT